MLVSTGSEKRKEDGLVDGYSFGIMMCCGSHHILLSWFLLSLPLLVRSQFDTGTIVELSNFPNSTAVSVVPLQDGSLHAVIGYESGRVEVIELEKGIMVHNSTPHQAKINHITKDSHGLVFLLYQDRVIQLDQTYQVGSGLTGEQTLRGCAVYNTGEEGRIALRFDSEIIEDWYSAASPQNQTKKGNKLQTEDGGVQAVEYSHDGAVLYAVNKKGRSLAAFSEEIVEHEDKEFNRTLRVTRRAVRFERGFSFQITQLIADHSEDQQGYPGLLVVSKDGSIFSTLSGTIQTFLPYSSARSSDLIAVDFCPRLFLAVLYREQDHQHYLTLFFKNTWVVYKRVALTDVKGFEEAEELSGMWCEQNKIVLRGQALLYVLNGFEVFRVYDYLDLQSAKWVVGALAMLLLAGVCCCKSRKRQMKTSQLPEKQTQPHQSQTQDSQPEQKHKNPPEQSGRRRKRKKN